MGFQGPTNVDFPAGGSEVDKVKIIKRIYMQHNFRLYKLVWDMEFR